jgi:hypothetical protein
VAEAVVVVQVAVHRPMDNQHQEVHKLDLGKLDKMAKTNPLMAVVVEVEVATAAMAVP